ncbi:MAG TPA: ATP-binding protein [Candidatus Eisenbacteria bacterium]|jgi:nitrogen fixation/metabolism regulation signal transduction histidine kinase
MLGTLRQRLLALFLLVSLIPSLGLTLVVTYYLSRSISALRNPETEHALAQSLEVIREGIERLGSDARQHAEVMALDPTTQRLFGSERMADLERHLREEARSRGLDYVCMYRIGPPIERVFGARLGPRITLPEPERETLLGALEQGGLITGGDAPRQVSGVAPLGKAAMILAGYQLDPEISKEILALQQNLTMYRKLGVYTWISERSLWIFAAIWTVVLGLVSFALAYFVSRDTARPILELRGAMEHVSSGDLSHRVKPSGTKEVRFLGTTFNLMVEELQTSRRALVRAERLAAWREVARAVAHEIRNPLTPIQFALERLRDEARRPEAPRAEVVRENADLILNEVHSLQEFVTSFSAVAQLPEPHFASCDVGALAENVAKLYRGSTPIEFRVEVAAPLPLAWADEAQIQRVLVNLIKNAMEASPERGIITLRALRDTNGAEPLLRVEIEDQGPGMDPATLERAVAPGFTTKSTGSGLGLTLVQRIVDQHSGRFVLESNPGIGTRAWFTLPVASEGAE